MTSCLRPTTTSTRRVERCISLEHEETHSAHGEILRPPCVRVYDSMQNASFAAHHLLSTSLCVGVCVCGCVWVWVCSPFPTMKTWVSSSPCYECKVIMKHPSFVATNIHVSRLFAFHWINVSLDMLLRLTDMIGSWIEMARKYVMSSTFTLEDRVRIQTSNLFI